MVTKTLFPRGSDKPCEGHVKQKPTVIFQQNCSSHYKPNILGSAFSACVESAKVGLSNVVTSTKQAWCALGMLSMVLTKRTSGKNSEECSSCTSVTLVGVGLMSGAMVAEPEAVAMGGLQSSLKTALANSQLVQEGRYHEFGAVVAQSSVVGGLKEAVKEVVYDSICVVAEAVGGELLADVVSPGIDAVLMATSLLRKLKVEENQARIEPDPSCAGSKAGVLSTKEVESRRAKELAQRTCVSIMSKGTGIAVCIIAGPAGGVMAATMAKYFLPKFF